tara:strand:+ start:6675 stop:7580 length:906 start_codon:yes stop_codon:yes gene_type:complete
LTDTNSPDTEQKSDRRRAIQRGAFWMIVAALSFTTMLFFVRYLEGRYPSIEVVFFRALAGLVFVIPILSRQGISGLRTKHFPMHVSRTVFALAAMFFFYYGVAYVPMSDGTAFTFIIPLFATVGAAIILREKVDAPRWTATIVGFLGTLIIIRPGYAEISLPVLAMLLSAVFYAGSWLSMKILTRTDSASLIVLYMNVMIVPLALIPTLILGKMPNFPDLLVLIGVGLTGSFAHFCQARSFASADASAVMPFDFLRLPMAVAWGWFFFTEKTDLWTWVGAVVIFSSTYYIAWRESRLKTSD